MNGLKEQLIDKGQELIAHPATAKAVSTYTVGIGAGIGLDVIQGWLGIVSATIGICIGILVLKIKYQELKKLQRENEKDAN